MAVRGRRVAGNPLASKLRELDLRTRPPRRGPTGAEGAAGPPGPAGADGEAGAQGPPGDPGTGVKGWNVVTTDGSGQATWTFPWIPAGTVTVLATPQAGGATIVTITALSVLQVTVTAYTVSGLPVSGVPVHLAAFV